MCMYKGLILMHFVLLVILSFVCVYMYMHVCGYDCASIFCILFTREGLNIYSMHATDIYIYIYILIHTHINMFVYT